VFLNAGTAFAVVGTAKIWTSACPIVETLHFFTQTFHSAKKADSKISTVPLQKGVDKFPLELKAPPEMRTTRQHFIAYHILMTLGK